MSNQVATRDLVGALAYLAGIIMLLIAISPFHWRLFGLAILIVFVGYLIAEKKLASMAGALFVVGVRFALLFLAGKGIIMLIGGLVSFAVVYVVIKYDPVSSAPALPKR